MNDGLNYDYLLVLKFSDRKRITLDRVPVVKTLDDEFEAFCREFVDSGHGLVETLLELRKSRLNVLRDYFHFCRYFNRAYEGLDWLEDRYVRGFVHQAERVAELEIREFYLNNKGQPLVISTLLEKINSGKYAEIIKRHELLHAYFESNINWFPFDWILGHAANAFSFLKEREYTKEELEENINDLFGEINQFEECIADYSSQLKEELSDRLQAFYLHETYQLCDVQVKNRQILTYSHRRTGWAMPIYDLTEDFKVQVKTNFGYGSASYFYIIITYKNFQIVPYSNWVTYPKSSIITEIIRYTRKYKLVNDSWADEQGREGVMTFLADACNLAMENEIEFCEKYIISECEEMVSKLEGILRNSKYIQTLYENVKFENPDDSRVVKNLKDDFAALCFRAEKIVGALNFIQGITELDKVVPMGDFVRRILRVNEEIIPVLEQALMEIVEKVSANKDEIIVLNEALSELQPRYDFYKGKLSEFTGLSGSYIEAQNMLQNEDKNYVDFSKGYSKLKNKLEEKKREVAYLEEIQEKISSYNNTIFEFLSSRHI